LIKILGIIKYIFYYLFIFIYYFTTYLFRGVFVGFFRNIHKNSVMLCQLQKIWETCIFPKRQLKLIILRQSAAYKINLCKSFSSLSTLAQFTIIIICMRLSSPIVRFKMFSNHNGFNSSFKKKSIYNKILPSVVSVIYFLSMIRMCVRCRI